MKKDKNTKPELSKEEYLQSLFNGAKDELEAYIVSNDQSAADKEPEKTVKEDEKPENKNEADTQNDLETDSEQGKPSISNANNDSDAPETSGDDKSDNDQSLEDDSSDKETVEGRASQRKGSGNPDEIGSSANEEVETSDDRKSK